MMNLPLSVLNELIEDRIIRQECQRRGITVSPEEVEIRLERQFGYDRNPPTPVPTITSTLPITITPTPTIAPMTYEEFKERSSAWFEAMQAQTGFTEQDFRRLVESGLYREKLMKDFEKEVPSTAEQIHARHILLESKEDAEKALERLKNGEDFAQVAKEMSTDTATKDNGGDLGWFPRGVMDPDFEQAAFALEPGETSGIVETKYGYHIIHVDEKDPNRPLSPAELAQKQREAFNKWLQEKRSSDEVVRKWSSAMIPTEIPTKAPKRR
ncbi:MAG: peptidylprolyl isomerase [Anaerolineae bacterium]|nr:peptidylprolyl isomerase [Anaerolineae bacterium]